MSINNELSKHLHARLNVIMGIGSDADIYHTIQRRGPNNKQMITVKVDASFGRMNHMSLPMKLEMLTSSTCLWWSGPGMSWGAYITDSRAVSSDLLLSV